MLDFSVIVQDPTIRAIVQENLLERAFHDALFPRQLFRGEASPVAWPAGVGDTQIFTAPGLMQPNLRPMRPGVDPTPVTYPVEQWIAQLQQYAGTTDVDMVTSMVAIANLFLRNAQQLGLQAAQVMNRIVRDRLYNAAESGWTVADGAQTATTSLRVMRLNGFTTARNPNTSNASQVRFSQVRSTNPLAIRVYDSSGPAFVDVNVTGYTPDTAGDEIGPGTLTISAAVTVSDRAAVYSVDSSYVIRVGGGYKVDDIGPQDVPTLANVRDAVAHFWQNNVPEHTDDRFHCHIDPVSQAKIFADAEFQRLMTALPDYYVYKKFALGEMLNTVFLRNSECPVTTTVIGGATATFSLDDPFAGELWNDGTTDGVKLHRMLFTAQAGIFEYYSDLSNLMSDAGITGKAGEFSITNNGIQVLTDRIQLIIRAPLNRLQDQVSMSWKFIGDWPVRTDAATGDASRYKRELIIIHGE